MLEEVNKKPLPQIRSMSDDDRKEKDEEEKSLQESFESQMRKIVENQLK